MGRHTAETASVRAPRQGDESLVNGERRAALSRDRDDRSPARRANAFGTSQAPVLPAGGAIMADTPPAPQSPTLDTAQLGLIAERSMSAAAAPSVKQDSRISRPRRTTKSVVERPLVAPLAVASDAGAPKRRTLASAFMRRRVAIPAMSFVAVFGFAGGSLVNPFAATIASAAVIAAPVELRTAPDQSYSPHGTYATAAISRDGYDITKPVVKVAPKPAATTTTSTTTTSKTSTTSTSSSSSTSTTASAPAAGTPDPGSAQAIAQQMVTARGWDSSQYSCLVSLWNRESGWNVYAYNPSGAYGIPQALPGSKMASVGADWQTNPATQITWGLNYISGVYGTPCGAWGHSQSFNWY